MGEDEFASLVLCLGEARRDEPERSWSELNPLLAEHPTRQVRALAWRFLHEPQAGARARWLDIGSNPLAGRLDDSLVDENLESELVPLRGLRIHDWMVDEGQDGQQRASTRWLTDELAGSRELRNLIHFELWYPPRTEWHDLDSGQRGVETHQFSGTELQRVAKALPAGLRTFSFSNELGTKALSMLTTASWWPFLTTLELPRNALRSNVATLFGKPTSLKRLDLSGNPLGDVGLSRLLRCPGLVALERLRVVECGTSAKGLEAAQRASTLPRLSRVEVD
jgi:hypothetical protein